MRISSNQIQSTGISTILNQQSQLAQTQNQLSTGQRITKPSDDPVAASRLLDLQQSLAVSQQHQSNADAATSRLNQEESILADGETQIARIRELALEGNNGSQSNDTRNMIASELKQIQEHLLQMANTQDSNGSYLFAGYQGDTRPLVRNADNTFTYNGDDGQRYIQVGTTRQVADANSGAQVYMNIKNGNGTFAVYDSASNTGTGVIDPGTVIDASAYVAQTYTVLFPQATDATDTALAAGAGSLPDDGANPTDNAQQYQLYINGVAVYTQDEGAATLTLNQLRDAINTSATNPGVVATVVDGTLHLANNPASNADITVQESLVDTGATPLDTTDTMTGYFGTVLTGDGVSDTAAGADIVYASGAADAYLVLDSTGAEVASGVYADGSQIMFNGIQTYITGSPNNGDSFTVEPSTMQDLFTTIQNLIDAFTGQISGDSKRAGLSNAVNRVLMDLDQANTNFLKIRADVGSRLAAIDSQKTVNDDTINQVQQVLSNIQDLDYASAISKLNLQMTSLQAAQQTYTKVQGLSLFNYL